MYQQQTLVILYRMPVIQNLITIETQGQGTYEITSKVGQALNESRLNAGTVTIFCCHTSCSLIVMENADRSARNDLERFLNDLVPENYPHYTHTSEGKDDMPSHIKMALTRTSEVIPFSHQQLQLGVWQGVFLWEHRKSPHRRKIIFTFHGE